MCKSEHFNKPTTVKPVARFLFHCCYELHNVTIFLHSPIIITSLDPFWLKLTWNKVQRRF